MATAKELAEILKKLTLEGRNLSPGRALQLVNAGSPVKVKVDGVQGTLDAIALTPITRPQITVARTGSRVYAIGDVPTQQQERPISEIRRRPRQQGSPRIAVLYIETVGTPTYEVVSAAGRTETIAAYKLWCAGITTKPFLVGTLQTLRQVDVLFASNPPIRTQYYHVYVSVSGQGVAVALLQIEQVAVYGTPITTTATLSKTSIRGSDSSWRDDGIQRLLQLADIPGGSYGAFALAPDGLPEAEQEIWDSDRLGIRIGILAGLAPPGNPPGVATTKKAYWPRIRKYAIPKNEDILSLSFGEQLSEIALPQSWEIEIEKADGTKTKTIKAKNKSLKIGENPIISTSLPSASDFLTYKPIAIFAVPRS